MFHVSLEHAMITASQLNMDGTGRLGHMQAVQEEAAMGMHCHLSGAVAYYYASHMATAQQTSTPHHESMTALCM